MKSRRKWGSDEEKEENMAALERVEKLYERMLRERESKPREEDGGKAAGVVAHGAKRAIDLMADTMSRFNPTSGGRDMTETMAMVGALVELVKGMKGENQVELIATIMRTQGESERALFMSQIQNLQNANSTLLAKLDEVIKTKSTRSAEEGEKDPLDQYERSGVWRNVVLADMGESGTGIICDPLDASQVWTVPTDVRLAGPRKGKARISSVALPSSALRSPYSPVGACELRDLPGAGLRPLPFRPTPRVY